MPEVQTPQKPARPKRRWWRRAGKFALWALLIFAIFHRPLLHFALRFVAIRASAHADLRLDLRIGGTLFTNLTIDSVHVAPTGAAPTPVRRIDIEHLRFDYSIPSLVKNGVGEFLHSYEMRNAHLDLVALPSKDDRERRKKIAIAEQLNAILGQPAAYADRVHIENFNLSVTAPENVTRIEGFDLLLDPEKRGTLRIARLEAPGLPAWENLAARTSYTKRNLFIEDLRLAPHLVIDELNFDASQRAQHIGGVWLKAHAFGGLAQVSLRGSQLDKKGENLKNAYNTLLNIEIDDVSLAAAADYFHAPRPPVATLSHLALNFAGEPELPRTWRGDLAVEIGALALNPATTIDTIAVAADFKNGHAIVKTGHASIGKNAVDLTAKIELPESVNDFPKSTADATFKMDAPELASLTSAMPMPLSGRVAGDGRVKVGGGLLDATLNIGAEKIANADLELGLGKLLLHFTKRIDQPGAAPLDQLTASLSTELTGVRFQTVNIDGAAVTTELQDSVLSVRKLEAHRAENTVSASGTARLPADLAQIATAPADLQFTIDAPRLETFGISANGATLSGHLAGRGAVKQAGGKPTGDLTLDGGDFVLGGFKAERLAAKVTVADDTATIEQFALQLNASDQLAIVGKTGIQKPFAYEGAVLFAVKNLAVFQPLAEIFGVKEKLDGALNIDWSGRGAIDPQRHEGKLSAAIHAAHYGKTELNDFALAGGYSPEQAQSSEFRIALGPTSLAGIFEWREGKLKLRDIALQQAKTTVLTGYLIVPLDPANTKQPVALDQRIAANLNATNLDIDKLLASFGQTSPATGTVTANLVTGGTLLEPFAHLKINARSLKAKALPQLAPADFDLTLHLANKDQSLEATLRQPQVQPLVVKGHAMLDLDATIRDRRIDPALPLDFTAKLPASSLAFVPKLTDQVMRIDGTAALDVSVAGTVEKPAISGSAAVALKGARLANENIPAIGVFDAALAFADDTLTFQKFRGEIGGGTFDLGGTVKLATTPNPVFDLRLQSKDVLAKRDDSVTVRADTDLKLAGPLNAATASGTVFVTHSRFFKEIDILPIGLPGRPPPPAPKTAPGGGMNVSFPNPPLRDWKFDIAIKTRDDDPFLIRGNLANGAASLNLRLAGTGLAPWLDGTIRIDKFTGSLPFSTISITRGFVYFKKDEPFLPSLDIQAESKTRDYTVSAYIYGRASDPQIQLSSEPPLQNGDIVSLLATGTTTSELSGSAEVLASRAAMLAVQQIYRKMFHRSAPPPDTKAADPNSMRDRFSVELGSVDNRTGQREVTTRFKLNEQYYLIGDLNTDGRFTGRLKYLIRFR